MLYKTSLARRDDGARGLFHAIAATLDTIHAVGYVVTTQCCGDGAATLHAAHGSQRFSRASLLNSFAKARWRASGA